MHVDAGLVSTPLHAAFEDIIHAQFPGDLGEVVGHAGIAGSGVARNDPQGTDAGQPCQDFILDALGEIGVVGVGAEIAERQHRDGNATRMRGVGTVRNQSGGDHHRQGNGDGGDQRGAEGAVPPDTAGVALSRFGLALETGRRQLVEPGNDHREGEADDDGHHHQPHRPVRDVEERKDLRGHLHQQPGCRGIEGRGPQYIATLQFLDQPVHDSRP